MKISKGNVLISNTITRERWRENKTTTPERESATEKRLRKYSMRKASLVICNRIGRAGDRAGSWGCLVPAVKVL